MISCFILLIFHWFQVKLGFVSENVMSYYFYITRHEIYIFLEIQLKAWLVCFSLFLQKVLLFQASRWAQK